MTAIVLKGSGRKLDLFVHCIRRKLERFGLEFLIRLRFLKYIAATLHLNADKFKLNCDAVPFFGHLLTKNGVKPDPKKVEAIRNWPVPNDITQLQSFLGAVNYLAKFIPHLSALRAPLQDLLKSNSKYVWSANHQVCFEQIKDAVCKDVTLKFYDPSLPTYIETVASQNGIGVVLLQPIDSNYTRDEYDIPTSLMPVAFASKTLTSTEHNYANIERELIDVSKDCNLNNPNELVKFLFLVQNQNARVRENLLKDMKPECTLQDCLRIAKLTEGTVHVEKLGQNFLANVDKHSQNVDAVNRGRPKSKGPHGFKGKSQNCSHSRSNGGTNGDGKRKVSCRNCGTSHPPRRCPAYGKKCHNLSRK